MAENLDDGVFWLPSEFLSDNDDDEKSVNDKNVTAVFNKKNDDVSKAMFSYLTSSPLESSETESSDEEEQYIAELTRRVAHSSLELDLFHHHHHSFPSPKPKGVVVSGSPQSTLCGCCGKRGSSSSHGSPNSVCQVTSQWATWDLLRAAAGEVERMRLSDVERRRFVNQNHNNTSLVVPNRNHNSIVGFNNHNEHSSISHQQLRIAQFEMLRQQQMAKQQIQQQGAVPVWCGAQNRGRNCEIGSVGGGGGGGVGRNVNAGLCSSAWPPLQRNVKQQNQQYGSGMRAVFLGNPSGKRESTGTGVFLPRRIDGPVESKKKPACSTVLVPARVVQALNLKLENMAMHQHNQPRFNVTSNMENGAASSIPRVRSSNNNYGFSQQKLNNLRPQPQVNHEIRLPQEWTY